MTMNTQPYALNEDTGFYEATNRVSAFLTSHTDTRTAKRKQARDNKFWLLKNRVYMQVVGELQNDKPVFLEIVRLHHSNTLWQTVFAEQGTGQLFQINRIAWNSKETGKNTIWNWTRDKVGLYNIFVADSDKSQALPYTDSGKFYTRTYRANNLTIANYSRDIVQNAVTLASSQGTFNGQVFSLGKENTPFNLRFDEDFEQDSGLDFNYPES